MRKLLYVGDDKTHDRYKRKYDAFITFVDGENNDVLVPGGNYYTHEAFAEYIREAKPYAVTFAFEAQDEFEYVISLICDFVGSIHLCAKHNKVFDFSPLEKCTELDAIMMYWNTKQTTLWDVKKNTKLRSFEMTDYYSVSDMSVFRGSSVEMLRFFGCNSCSSFVSRMHVDDLSFVLDMPKLTELRFDIVKDEPSEYYLDILSKLQGLKIFYLDTNGDYFELLFTPKFKDTDNATKAYGFITYLGTGTVYDKDNNPVCEIPIDELEFVVFSCLDAVITGYYCRVETEFGRLYFDYSNDLFYLQFEEGEVDYREYREYYQLIGKNLDELIAEYSATSTD